MNVPGNGDAQGASTTVEVGRDLSGILVRGDHNTVTSVKIDAQYGSQVTVHAGPVPVPVKRQPISQLPRSAAQPPIGREDELARLRQAIETKLLVHLWGPSGIGKSALLRQLARTLPRGPEGVAYIEAGGRTVDDIAQAIFDISFDAPNYKPSLEVLKEHLKTLRLRIYLDDAGLAEKELRRLFDLAPHSTFVFSTERQLMVGGAYSIELGGLTAPAAVTLMRSLLGRALRPGEDATLVALRDAVDGNPLKLRRIASSGADKLPGIMELPELVPALVHRLDPQEKDLLHLLGSLAGAELAGRHLNDLLEQADAAKLADGLVRRGLLLASETGYSCPADVAEHVLKLRATEFPVQRLCERLTAWVAAADTSPDDVAAHFRALDIAVLRAEARGHADLGVALARAASPKLARSLQFDAWGTLLGAGWAAATTADDKAGKAFFLHEEGVRNKALGRTATAAILLSEAAILWRELGVIHMHSAALQAANTNVAVAATQAAHSVALPGAAPNPAVIAHMTRVTQLTNTASTTPVRPVVNLSPAGRTLPGQPSTAPTTHAPLHLVHSAPANPAPSIPKQINLSHTQAPTHAAASPARPVFDAHKATYGHPAGAGSGAQTPSPQHGGPPTGHAASGGLHHGASAASGGHSVAVGAAATGAKGVSALAVSSVVSLVAVVGAGVAIYTNGQSYSSATSTSSPTAATSAYVDPVCGPVISTLNNEIGEFNDDLNSLNSATDVYNSSSDPDFGPVSTAADDAVGDLRNMVSTLQSAQGQAQDSAVITSLGAFSSSVQEIIGNLQSFADQSTTEYDTTSGADQANAAFGNLQDACGD